MAMTSRTSSGVLVTAVLSACIAVALHVGSPAAWAQKPQDAVTSADVSEALGRMSKTLLATDFSFDSQTLRAYAGPNGELLHIAHNIKTVVRRPDRLLVDVTGDDGATKLFFDGVDLALYSPDGKQYVRINAPGKIEEMVDVAEASLGVDFPLADFMNSDPQKAFLEGITTGTQVGTTNIDGTRCRHFFFTQASELEMELWLEDNDKALPRRLVVTYLNIPGRPRFIAELSNWDFTTKHLDTDFVFQPPTGVKQVELTARPRTRSLPAAK
jgi:hypothetical protein